MSAEPSAFGLRLLLEAMDGKGWPLSSSASLVYALHRNEVDLAVKAAGHAVRAQPPLAPR
jgi:hypothetical protein